MPKPGFRCTTAAGSPGRRRRWRRCSPQPGSMCSTPSTRPGATTRPPRSLPVPPTWRWRRRSPMPSDTARGSSAEPRPTSKWWLSSGPMPRPASDAVSIRQAVLLVGGRGTRMWPLTSDVPKGLLPLAGVPFVEYQLRQLAAAGISEVFLAVGRELLGAWERYAATSPGGLAVRLVVEEEPLDTAGPVRAVLDLLDDRFLVLNGDVVVEADLAALLGDHGEATLGLVEVADTSAYGVVVTRSDGVVDRFIEKPPTAEAPARTVNAGMYALDRAVLAGYPEGRLSFERVVFPELAAAGALRAVVLTGRWIDIGTPSLYLAAHDVVYAGGSVLHRPAATHENAGA